MYVRPMVRLLRGRWRRLWQMVLPLLLGRE
jgi:hypothetical protein